jgi:predicted RND superfamily exporter protein
LISVVWGPSVLLTCLSFFQIPIGLVNSTLLAITVGLAGDNTIQYMFHAENKDLEFGANTIGVGSLVLASIMIGLSAFFLFSPFANVQLMGKLLILSVLLFAIGDLFILKSLLKLKYFQ